MVGLPTPTNLRILGYNACVPEEFDLWPRDRAGGDGTLSAARKQLRWGCRFSRLTRATWFSRRGLPRQSRPSTRANPHRAVDDRRTRQPGGERDAR